MRVRGFPFRFRVRLGVSQVLPVILLFGAGPCTAQSLYLNHSFETPDGPYPQHWEPHPYRNPARTDVAHINGTDAADGDWYVRVVALDYLSGYFYFGWTPSDTNYEILPGGHYRLTYSYRLDNWNIWRVIYMSVSIGECHWEDGNLVCNETFYWWGLDDYPPPGATPLGVWVEGMVEFETPFIGPDDHATFGLLLGADGFYNPAGSNGVDYDNIRLEYLGPRATFTPTNTPTDTPTNTPTATNTATATFTPRPPRTGVDETGWKIYR